MSLKGSTPYRGYGFVKEVHFSCNNTCCCIKINNIPNVYAQFKHSSSQNLLQMWANYYLNVCITYELLFTIKCCMKFKKHKAASALSSFFKSEALKKHCKTKYKMFFVCFLLCFCFVLCKGTQKALEIQTRPVGFWFVC